MSFQDVRCTVAAVVHLGVGDELAEQHVDVGALAPQVVAEERRFGGGNHGVSAAVQQKDRSRRADAARARGESAGSSDAELLEVRHERRPQFLDGAVVDVVHVGPRRLRQHLRHLARLGERGVRLVHAHERQLRRQQKRLDPFAQARRPDRAARRRDRPAHTGSPRRRSRAADASRVPGPAAPRRWSGSASRAGRSPCPPNDRTNATLSRIDGRLAAEIDSPPAKLMPTMPTRAVGREVGPLRHPGHGVFDDVGRTRRDAIRLKIRQRHRHDFHAGACEVAWRAPSVEAPRCPSSGCQGRAAPCGVTSRRARTTAPARRRNES